MTTFFICKKIIRLLLKFENTNAFNFLFSHFFQAEKVIQQEKSMFVF